MDRVRVRRLTEHCLRYRLHSTHGIWQWRHQLTTVTTATLEVWHAAVLNVVNFLACKKWNYAGLYSSQNTRSANQLGIRMFASPRCVSHFLSLLSISIPQHGGLFRCPVRHCISCTDSCVDL